MQNFLTTSPPTQSTVTLECHWNHTNNICSCIWHSATRSNAIWHCNANDCIHQMSFVSYSLCSLSFLPQTPLPLQCAQRCVHGSIPAAKPTLIRQSRVPREWPAKSLHPLSSPSPFCAQCHSLSSSMWSVFPCSAHHAKPSPTAGRTTHNERGSGEICNSHLLPSLLIFLRNRPFQPAFCRVRLLKTTTATKRPKPARKSQQPSRPAQTENGIDKFGKGQTLILTQAGTQGFFFPLNLSLLNTVQHIILYLQRKASGGWSQRLIPL